MSAGGSGPRGRDWSVSDALYMTIITLSAVGYQEVRPLTDQGRLITGLLLAGVTLAEARIRNRTSLIVIAIRHGEGAFIYNPGLDEEIRAEDYLIVLGGSEQIDSLQEIVRA